jgi:dephospho-CoA kinase
MILGITGPNASGKGEVSRYLVSKGYRYRSLSDILREISTKKGIEPTRENLIRLGNEMRSEKGAGILAVMALKRLNPEENTVVDSIRNPFEIEVLRKMPGFFLIGVDAPVELRFERLRRRKRSGDPKTIKELIDNEAAENIDARENQQLTKCLEMADFTIINDSSIKKLHRKIDDIIEKINKKT